MKNILNSTKRFIDRKYKLIQGFFQTQQDYTRQILRIKISIIKIHNLQLRQPNIYKKIKKENNKKSKKKENEDVKYFIDLFTAQGIEQLKNLVERIYYEEESFEELEYQFQITVQKISEFKIFFSKLDEMIKQYAEEAIQNVLSQTNNIILALQEQRQKNNSLLKLQFGSSHFHVILIRKIYEQLQIIKSGSFQIEKMINYYNLKNSVNLEGKMKITNLQLYARTSNYMINFDKRLKNWIACSKNYFGDVMNPKLSQLSQQLAEILQIIKQPECQLIIDYSSLYEQKAQNQSYPECRQLKYQYQSQQQHYIVLLNSLENLSLSPNRIQLNYSQIYIQNLQSMFSSNIRSNRNRQTQ